MHTIDNLNELGTICKNTSIVAVLFYSDWCPYSMIAKNAFNALGEIDGLIAAKVRTDVATSDITKLTNAIPEILIVKDQKIIDKFNGVLPPEKLKQKLIQLVSDYPFSDKNTFNAVLNCNRDFTAYGAKGTVKIYDSDNKYIDYIVVDRISLNIIIFFEYAKRYKISDRLIYNGQLTQSSIDLSNRLKRDLGVHGMLHGIDNLYEKKDKKYIQKQIYRINKLFQIIAPPFIVRKSSGDYTIDDVYSIEIHWES